eukprot:1149518-Pelagomonas_calceolata.AAC.2
MSLLWSIRKTDAILRSSALKVSTANMSLWVVPAFKVLGLPNPGSLPSLLGYTDPCSPAAAPAPKPLPVGHAPAASAAAAAAAAAARTAAAGAAAGAGAPGAWLVLSSVCLASAQLPQHAAAAAE